MATKIPLKCDICPKRPRFSDVSHLLTHISSKTHLSNIFKAKVRADLDTESRRLVEDYDQWFAEWNIQDLLAERLSQKENKAPRPRPRANNNRTASSRAKRAEKAASRASSSTANTAPPQPLDPSLVVFPARPQYHPSVPSTLSGQLPSLWHLPYPSLAPPTHPSQIHARFGSRGIPQAPQFPPQYRQSQFTYADPRQAILQDKENMPGRRDTEDTSSRKAKSRGEATRRSNQRNELRPVDEYESASEYNDEDGTSSEDYEEDEVAAGPSYASTHQSSKGSSKKKKKDDRCPDRALVGKQKPYPGQHCFDAGTPEQINTRNQPKAQRVYDKLKRETEEMRPIEKKWQVDASGWTQKKSKEITGNPAPSSIGSISPSRPPPRTTRRRGPGRPRGTPQTPRTTGYRQQPSATPTPFRRDRRAENDLAGVMYSVPGTQNRYIYRDQNDDETLSADTFGMTLNSPYARSRRAGNTFGDQFPADLTEPPKIEDYMSSADTQPALPSIEPTNDYGSMNQTFGTSTMPNAYGTNAYATNAYGHGGGYAFGMPPPSIGNPYANGGFFPNPTNPYGPPSRLQGLANVASQNTGQTTMPPPSQYQAATTPSYDTNQFNYNFSPSYGWNGGMGASPMAGNHNRNSSQTFGMGFGGMNQSSPMNFGFDATVSAGQDDSGETAPTRDPFAMGGSSAFDYIPASRDFPARGMPPPPRPASSRASSSRSHPRTVGPSSTPSQGGFPPIPPSHILYGQREGSRRSEGSRRREGSGRPEDQKSRRSGSGN